MTHSSSSFSLMKRRLWRRRMSVSSPRMRIKSELPWTWRLAIGGTMLLLVAVAAVWGYDSGRRLSNPQAATAREQLERFKERIEQLNEEREKYATMANAAESRINMEQSAQKQLAAQIKTLEAENATLKEDLAFFESLLPNAIGPQGISIRRMKLDRLAPNQFRYRLLIMQGGKGENTFLGTLQLVVSTLQEGKSAMMTFPDSSPAEQEKFKLRFRYYQRVEGVLTLPEGVTVQAVQARVLEKDQVRAQQSANL